MGKRKANSTLGWRRSSGGVWKKDREKNSTVKGWQNFKVRARC